MTKTQATYVLILLTVVAVAALWWMEWAWLGADEPPSGAQIRKVCARHQGVASVTSAPLLGAAPIVCRDGWVGYR